MYLRDIRLSDKELKMSKNIGEIEVDLVYLWVDGNDPVWQAKRKSFTGVTDEKSPINCKGRYANNDELKYSLRSIEENAPWIRNIFIVTDNQTPEWLDTSNTKIKIIDHSEILPKACLPCYNSSLLEKYIYRIPNLAEHFIFANDDMFLNKAVSPSDFYTNDGKTIIRLIHKPFRKIRWFFRERIFKKPLKNYSKKIHHSSLLVEDRYGCYITGMPHHNIDAYKKSYYRQIVEVKLCKEYMLNDKNHIRSNNDTHRSVISYMSLAEKHGLLRYVSQKESMLVRIHKEKDYRKLEEFGPMFFCMNDSEYATDKDRAKVKDYLEKRFPNKSEFEK